ncbi:MAG: PIG-L family deacetylase [Gemmatimonadaceae bacterium]
MWLTTFLAGATVVPAGGAADVRQQSNSTGVDVVVVAHADDWQVFMGDVIVERIKSGRRLIFIYMTAGDHGRETAYWRQRELAAMQSTRIALGIADAAIGCDSVVVREHRIAHCKLGVSDSYFFRLPDGNRNGRGFARNRFESLRKLHADRGSSASAVDSSTRYSDWQDLNATVSTLVRMVADSAGSSVMLHTTDPSIRINPHDHYDHRMAGKLIENLLSANGWRGRYYVGYALAMRAPNRTTLQRQEKTEVFSAYDREMKLINPAWSAYREHPGFYAECMQRTYSRSVMGVSARSRMMIR